MWGTKKKLLRVHESWHVRPLISATRTLQFTQSPADTKMWTSQPQNKMVNKGKLITYPHRQYWGKNLITLYTWWCLLDTSRRCHHANAQLGQAWTTVATEVWAAYPPNFRPLPEPDLIHKISEQRNSPILFKIIKHKYLDAVESLSDGVTSIYYSSGKLVYQQPLLVPTQQSPHTMLRSGSLSSRNMKDKWDKENPFIQKKAIKKPASFISRDFGRKKVLHLDDQISPFIYHSSSNIDIRIQARFASYIPAKIKSPSTLNWEDPRIPWNYSFK